MKYLICKYDDKSTTHYHITHMFDELIKKYSELYSYLIFENMTLHCESKEKLSNYFINEYGSIPKYIISFAGIGSFANYYKIICAVTQLIFIVDDIHHGKSVRNPRIPVIKKSQMIFATYAYQFERWGLPKPTKLFFFPHSARWTCEYNLNPINKVLISGRVSNIYPDREFALEKAKLHLDLFDVLKCDVNYRSLNEGVSGKKFYNYLNKYICCFVDTARDYILAKTFEICASGSLLLCSDSNVKSQMEKIGFINNINYISCSRENFMERVEWILNPDNINQVELIRKKGYEFIINNHTMYDRLNFFHEKIENEK